ALSNHGLVSIRDRRAPLVGRVSMDQCVADVTDVPDVRAGDVAAFFGGRAVEQITLDEAAEHAGTVPHELLCRIGARVSRVYQRGLAMGPANRVHLADPLL